MFQAARSAVGTVARQIGRGLDGLGAALEPHPYYEQCELGRQMLSHWNKHEILVLAPYPIKKLSDLWCAGVAPHRECSSLHESMARHFQSDGAHEVLQPASALAIRNRINVQRFQNAISQLIKVARRYMILRFP